MEGDQEPDDLSAEARQRRNADYAVEMLEQQIETSRIAYEVTKNPVYVWRSMHHLKLISLLAKDDLNNIELARKAATPPSWCMEYLLECAHAVDKLSVGSDPRLHGHADPLSEAQKTEIIPVSFGFVRPGWNAFDQYSSIFEMKWVERYFWELRDEGVSYTEALAQTAERYEYHDVRSLRRKLAKRRAVFTGKTLPTRRKNRPNP